MNIEVLILNGYGQFVWPAFIFTFLSLLLLYIKTKKEFNKVEKVFNKEFNQSEILKARVIEKKENTKAAWATNSI
tara:strand:+ start:1488 stop:1712 length:225 start_codon:yes stop_codon:yes gene_type:complete